MKKRFVKSKWQTIIIFFVFITMSIVSIGCSSLSVGNMQDALTQSLKVDPIVKEFDVSSESPLNVIIPNDQRIAELQFGKLRSQPPENIKKTVHTWITNYGRHPYSFEGYRSELKGNDLVIYKVKGSSSATPGEEYDYISITLQQNTTVEGDKLKISYIPTQKKQVDKHRKGLKEFTTSEWHDHLSGLKLNCKYELDSEFPPQSIQANFQRRFRQGSHDKYMMMYNSIYIPFKATITPYRNGSKTVVQFDIPKFTSNDGTIDFSYFFAGINKKIKEVFEE